MTAQVVIHPTAEYLDERIRDAQHWVWSLEYDLVCLRDGSLGWRVWFDGSVTKSGTEREMRERAIAECAAALEQAQRDLEALQAQVGEAATERPGGNGR